MKLILFLSLLLSSNIYEEIEKINIKIINQTEPSLVTITTPKGQGSGFIIDKDGLIFTNSHIVAEEIGKMKVAKSIVIHLNDKRKRKGIVISHDPELDVALVKIVKENSDDKFKAIKLGDSDKIKVGQYVMALGSPFGLDRSLSVGVVSYIGRALGKRSLNYIQVDASINPGNSGGPLLNTKGEVIGINSLKIIRGEGLSFAIPINAAKLLRKRVVKEKELKKGELGIKLSPLTDDLIPYYKTKIGAIVTMVKKGSPAYEAGLKIDDVIVEYDNKPVDVKSEESLTNFMWRINTTPVGKEVKIKIVRNGIKKELYIIIGKKEATTILAKEKDYPILGLKLKEVVYDMYIKYNLKTKKGLFIEKVYLGSPAEEARILPKDVIVAVDNNPIHNISSFNLEIKNIIIRKKPIILTIYRRQDRITTILMPNYQLKNKVAVIIVPSNDFNEKEYNKIKELLEFHGATIKTATETSFPAKGDKGSKLIPDIVIDRLSTRKFDILIIIGGKGAISLSKNFILKRLVKSAYISKRILGAIDEASMVFVESDIISKQNITGSENIRPLLVDRRINYTGKDIEIDRKNKIITANGENTVENFVNKIVSLVKK